MFYCYLDFFKKTSSVFSCLQTPLFRVWRKQCPVKNRAIWASLTCTMCTKAEKENCARLCSFKEQHDESVLFREEWHINPSGTRVLSTERSDKLKTGETKRDKACYLSDCSYTADWVTGYLKKVRTYGFRKDTHTYITGIWFFGEFPLSLKNLWAQMNGTAPSKSAHSFFLKKLRGRGRSEEKWKSEEE